MAKPGTARVRILEQLADGKPKTANQLAADISLAYGFSVFTVAAELSTMAYMRNIKRERIGRVYVYRRTDVGAPAA